MPSALAGRYEICEQIAAGGMATVHLGRLQGSAGFTRAVAIKRLHPAYASDPSFASMLIDEARLAARIRHPNVVTVLDVVSEGAELFVVMEYVHGESLASLLRASKRRVPLPIAASIMVGVLHGLHAAHTALDADGHALGIVHRDVSPQNVLVGVDGLARVLDFGVAKAAARLQTTAEGQVKGKLAYMAREQLEGSDVDARADVFAAGVIFWELVTGERLFEGKQPGEIAAKVLLGKVSPPSARAPQIAPALDALILRALATERQDRFASALDMAVAIEAVAKLTTPREIGAWVHQVSGDALSARAASVANIERGDAVPASARTFPHALDVGTLSTLAALPARGAASAAESGGPKTRIAKRDVVLLALVAAAVAAVALAVRTPRDAATATSVARADASAFSASELLETNDPVAAAPQAERTAAPSEPAPPAASSASAGPSRKTAPMTQHRASRPTLRTPKRETCDPPYFVSSNGIHVPKPQCLE